MHQARQLASLPAGHLQPMPTPTFATILIQQAGPYVVSTTFNVEFFVSQVNK